MTKNKFVNIKIKLIFENKSAIFVLNIKHKIINK